MLSFCFLIIFLSMLYYILLNIHYCNEYIVLLFNKYVNDIVFFILNFNLYTKRLNESTCLTLLINMLVLVLSILTRLIKWVRLMLIYLI